VAGVASPRVLQDGETVGYRVRDLATGEEFPLCSREPPGIAFRKFFFSPDGLAFANAALRRAAGEAAAILVDEVGPLELAGGGFAPGMRAALSSPAFLVLTVRPSLVDEVRAWAGLPAATPVWALSPTGADIRRMGDHRVPGIGKSWRRLCSIDWGGSIGL
jgi:nucleoside-triphosphatase THEP1